MEERIGNPGVILSFHVSKIYLGQNWNFMCAVIATSD